jgi:transposase-like protein
MVEMLGRYSNRVDQGERLRALVETTPLDPVKRKVRTKRRAIRRLSEPEVAELVAGYTDGIPIAQLTKRFNIDQTTLQKHVRRHGLSRRSERVAPSRLAEAVDLYRSGRSVDAIARTLDVGSTTVRRALGRAGEPLRPRGRPRSGPRQQGR